jgi:hypothetical protein
MVTQGASFTVLGQNLEVLVYGSKAAHFATFAALNAYFRIDFSEFTAVKVVGDLHCRGHDQVHISRVYITVGNDLLRT